MKKTPSRKSVEFLAAAETLLGQQETYKDMIESAKRNKPITMTALCRKFGIQRTYGYYLISKYLIKEKL